MLCTLPTIKQPNVSIESQRESGMIPCAGRLGGGCPKEGDINIGHLCVSVDHWRIASLNGWEFRKRIIITRVISPTKLD